MELGYIHFSTEEKNNLYKVIQSIREHHAIDELGIGRIRDCFSNRMFPGMSTLQNRAKYFAVLPSLYQQAERFHYNNVKEVRAKIIDLEIKLTNQLINGNPEHSDTGITGSNVIADALRNPNKYVKYDPTYIYMGGLMTYGMVSSNGNIYRLIFERSKAKASRPERFAGTDKEGGDDYEQMGTAQPFNTGGLTYVFDGKTPMSIKLTRDEAAFIKEMIETSPHSQDSLLSYLLQNPDLSRVSDYLGNERLWNNLPGGFRSYYLLSVRFSKFIYLLRLYYNYLYCFKTGNENGSAKYLDEFNDYLENNGKEFTVHNIEEILMYVCDDVTDSNLLAFCREAARILEDGDIESNGSLAQLIIKREHDTKGGRAKLLHPDRYKGQPHTEAQFLDYRWNLVFSMLNEIMEGPYDGE